MARAGQELTATPVRRDRLVFRRTARETGGRFLEVEAFYAEGGEWPPEHCHPHQDERFEVLSGRMAVRSGRRERTYGAGEAFTIPAGAPHSMRSAPGCTAHVVWRTTPAMDTEVLFETLWGLAADGKTDRSGVPNPLQMAVLLREYRHVFRLSRPPAGVQWVLLGALALIGRAIGYRGRYARYSGPEHSGPEPGPGDLTAIHSS